MHRKQNKGAKGAFVFVGHIGHQAASTLRISWMESLYWRGH